MLLSCQVWTTAVAGGELKMKMGLKVPHVTCNGT